MVKSAKYRRYNNLAQTVYEIYCRVEGSFLPYGCVHLIEVLDVPQIGTLPRERNERIIPQLRTQPLHWLLDFCPVQIRKKYTALWCNKLR